MAKKKGISTDELAADMQRKFLIVGRRFDHLEQKIDDGFKAATDILDLVRDDLRDMKIALGPLVRTVASLEEAV